MDTKTKNKAGRPALYQNPVDVLFRTEENLIKRAKKLYPNETRSRALHLCLNDGVRLLEGIKNEYQKCD